MGLYNDYLNEKFFLSKKKDKKSNNISEELFKDKALDKIHKEVKKYTPLFKKYIKDLNMDKFCTAIQIDKDDIFYYPETGVCTVSILYFDIYDFRNLNSDKYPYVREIECSEGLYKEIDKMGNYLKEKIKLPEGFKFEMVDDGGDWDDFTSLIVINQSYIKNLCDNIK